jgi:hypothetical protein
VVAFILLALGIVYGLGAIWFAWWDGGAVRRILIALCAIAVVYGALNFIRHHPLPESETHIRH